MEGTYLLAMRCPVYRRRDSHPGFRTELENLVGDAKGEGPSGKPREADSTDVPNRGGLLRSSDEPGEFSGSEGGGSPSRDRHGSTGNRRNPMISAEGAGLPWVARAV
jgi:hypothetical protein